MHSVAAASDRLGVAGLSAAAQLLASEPVNELTKNRLAPGRNGKCAKPLESTPTPIDAS
jgi:hypothetical protein